MATAISAAATIPGNAHLRARVFLRCVMAGSFLAGAAIRRKPPGIMANIICLPVIDIKPAVRLNAYPVRGMIVGSHWEPGTTMTTTSNDGQHEEVSALLDELHRLEGEYRRHMQEEVDGFAKHQLEAGRNLGDVIVGMSHLNEALRLAHQPLVDALDDALRRLCDSYLQAPEEQRADIRAALSRQKMLLVHLINLTGSATLAIPRGRAAYWLQTGLAAISIEDNRTDSRDTCVALQYLCAAAVKAGVEPRQYFEHVAALSSSSMQEFLLGFIRRDA